LLDHYIRYIILDKFVTH